MEIEDLLKSLKLRAPVEGLREPVLRAARAARFDRRLWRWTWTAAAAVLAVAIPLNLFMGRISIGAQDAILERRVDPVSRSSRHDAIIDQSRLALMPRRSLERIREIP